MKWIKKYFNKELGTGLIKDQRPFEEKQKDYLAEEVLSYVPPKWVEKSPTGWRKFPIFNQSQSSSCVGQTYAKLLGVENFLEENKWVNFSARDIYSQRKNKPDKGMWSQDAANIVYHKGVSLEQLMPSQNLPELEMNKDHDRKEIDKQIALVGKAGGYLSLSFDFDRLASIIEQTGKAVAISCWFNSGDWSKAEVITRSNGTYGHLIAVTDYCLWKGKKALVFDNSWGTNWGYNGQGLIIEGQHQGVRDYCVYLQDLHNNWRDTGIIIEKPKYTFDKNLNFGMRDRDIIALQSVLKYFEYYPIEAESTGYYGKITSNAIMAWQLKHEIDTPEIVKTLKGEYFGPLSRIKMNELLK